MNATLPAVEESAAPIPLSAPGEPTSLPLSPDQRLVSLDAFRGLAMVLMASAGLSMVKVAESYKDNYIWQRLAYHTDHVPWTGCALWDLIQPWFMFMVGAAIPFSIASRRAKGQGFGRMLFHAVWRAVALTLLGVYLTSNSSKQTDWAFANVLSQIGLGYVFLFLLAWIKPRWQWVAAFSILFFYWLAFALHPAPAAGFDFATVNAKDWPYRLQGFVSHWEKNTNWGAYVDQWFLNLFPRKERFTGNPGGYVTLNFVPALVTMLFGLLAGQLLRWPGTAARKIMVLLVATVAGLGMGYVLDRAGICPIVKRIWTPSWTLFSTGWACLALACFYLTLDVVRVRFWAFPLVIVGMNSIAVYVLSNTMKPYFRETVASHFGQDVWANIGRLLGGAHFAPMVQSAMFLLAVWLIALWMYRRRLFLKV
jgi:heparan-alpha-glucosaminide N-acetyltransferase